MIEKILVRAAGVDSVAVGDLVVCDIDRIVLLDLNFSTSNYLRVPKRVANPERLVVILDHAVPAPSIHDAAGHSRARQFVKDFDIPHFFDVGRRGGICHQVIMENALALPGSILTCSDSHTIGSGAFNCAARGLGGVEMVQIACTGKTWFKVSPTAKFVLEGVLPRGVFAKDILLYIAHKVGSVEGHSVEFAGAIDQLGMEDRATLATMCAEISADFATFPVDDVTRSYVSGRTDDQFEPVEPDPDASYASVTTLNLSSIKPFVALPDAIPHNSVPVDELADGIRVDQAFIGSCANGKLEDLRVAAEILRGRRVADGVRLVVTPASQRVYLDALRRGYVEALVESGAVVTNSTCGACYGGHLGVVGPGEVCITSSTRNFKGRMGSPEAKIYMASSATVAASAITGCITDPTPFFSGAAS